MVQLAPETQIILCKGVNIDSDYSHTYRPKDRSDQYNTIVSHKKYVFDKNTYQRTNEGKLRIQVKAEDIYDCNYMVFQNRRYGTKYFYAFIDSIDYINDGCTEISYTIDVMQTWFFDFEMRESFVEREHSATDNLGENLVEENIGSGELIIEKAYTRNYESGNYCVVFYIPNDSRVNNVADHLEIVQELGGNRLTLVMATDKTDYGNYTNRTLCPYSIFGFEIKSYTDDVSPITNGLVPGGEFEHDPSYTLKVVIDALIAADANILHVAQVPKEFYLSIVLGKLDKYDEDIPFVANTVFKSKNGNEVYTPRNNKLYNYPYKQLNISNNAGSTATYKYENFKSSDLTAEFMVTGTISPSTEMMLYPLNYRQKDTDFESGLTLTEFISPPWSEDTFTKWWEQNKYSIATSYLCAGIKISAAVASAFTGGGVVPAIFMGVGGVTDAIKPVMDTSGAQLTPDQVSGQFGLSSLRAVQDRIGYTFYDMGVDATTAKIIDDYFTMFGYATKQVKIPNVFAIDANTKQPLRRPHWNYIKTQMCVIHASKGLNQPYGLNAADEKKICDIFNNGITFWENLDEVGDYSLDNSPSYSEPIPTPTPEPEPIIPDPPRYIIPFVAKSCTMTQNFKSATYQGGHNGYDLIANGDKHVVAIADGNVIFAGAGTGSYASLGNYVAIQDTNGFVYYYGHLSTVSTTIGADVSKGTVIGVQGNTGDSTGEHLHLAIREGTQGLYLNPERFTNIPNTNILPAVFTNN